MHDPLTFETRLSNAFERFLAGAPVEVDAVTMAVIASAAAPRSYRDRLGLRSSGGGTMTRGIRGRGLVIAALLLVAALIGTAMAVGMLPLVEPKPIAKPVVPALEGRWVTAQLLQEILGGPSGLTRFSLDLPTEGSVASVRNNPNATVGLAFESIFRQTAGEITLETAQTVVADSQHGFIDTPGPGQRGCLKGDLGRYRYSVSRDNLHLSLNLISDDCPARAGFMPRVWIRQLSTTSTLGVGVVQVNQDLIQLTLPAGSYSINSTIGDRVVITRHDGDLAGSQVFVLTDPVDFAAATCSTEPAAGQAIGSESQMVAAFVGRHPDIVDAFGQSPERMLLGVSSVHVGVHAADGCDASVIAMQLWPTLPIVLQAGGRADLYFLQRGDHAIVVGLLQPTQEAATWEEALLSSLRIAADAST